MLSEINKQTTNAPNFNAAKKEKTFGKRKWQKNERHAKQNEMKEKKMEIYFELLLCYA